MLRLSQYVSAVFMFMFLVFKPEIEKEPKIDTSSLWWTSKDSNCVHEGMGSGIPIKIARMSTRRKLRKVWSTGESCPSVYGFLK